MLDEKCSFIAGYSALKLPQYMGLDATKPVFGVADISRLKPVSSAMESSLKIEILLVASLDMILSNKALIRLHRCTGWSAPLLFTNPQRQIFLRQGPYLVIGNNTKSTFLHFSKYSKTCLKQQLNNRQNNGLKVKR